MSERIQHNIQDQRADFAPGEVLIKTFVPSSSTFWFSEIVRAVIAIAGAAMGSNAGSGLERMLGTAMFCAATFFGMRDLFRKPQLMAERWILTNRRLITPSQAWQLQELQRVRSYFNDIQILTTRGEKAALRYLPSGNIAMLTIKAAKGALK